jgi:hypothetical protein
MRGEKLLAITAAIAASGAIGCGTRDTSNNSRVETDETQFPDTYSAPLRQPERQVLLPSTGIIEAVIVSGSDKLGTLNVDLADQPSPRDALPPGADSTYVEQGDVVNILCESPTVDLFSENYSARKRPIRWLGVEAVNGMRGFILTSDVDSSLIASADIPACQVRVL